MAEDEKRYQGKVKLWFDDKGHGFIRPDEGGDDVFVHKSEIKVDGSFVSLRVDQEVEYSLKDVDQKRGKAWPGCKVTAPGGGALETQPQKRRPPQRSRSPRRRGDSRSRSKPLRRRDDSRDGRPGGDRRDSIQDEGRSDRNRGYNDDRDRSRSSLPRAPGKGRPRVRDDSRDGGGQRRRNDGRDCSRSRDNRRREPVQSASNKDTRLAIQDAEDAVRLARHEEKASEAAFKKIEAAVKRATSRKVQEAEKDEKGWLDGQVERMEKESNKALQAALDETEQKIQGELEQKIRELKADYKEKLEDALRKVEDENADVRSQARKQLTKKSNQRVQEAREDAEQDEERDQDLIEFREKHRTAKKRLQEEEDKLADLTGEAPPSGSKAKSGAPAKKQNKDGRSESYYSDDGGEATRVA